MNLFILGISPYILFYYCCAFSMMNCAKIFIDNPLFNINMGIDLDGLSISPFYISIIKSVDDSEFLSSDLKNVSIIDLLLSRPDLNVNLGKKEKRRFVNVGYFSIFH
jgi:hypothetical protein